MANDKMVGHERMELLEQRSPTEYEKHWSCAMLRQIYKRLKEEREIWDRHPKSSSRHARIDTIDNVLSIFKEES